MNAWSAFSFITPIGGILFYIFFAGRWLSKGKLALRAASCILAFFVIQSVDYIVFIGMALLQGSPRELFDEFMRPDFLRVSYLFVDKGLDIVIYYLLRKRLRKLSMLRDKIKLSLFVSTAISYGVMQYLFFMVMHGNSVQLQGAAMISFAFAVRHHCKRLWKVFRPLIRYFSIFLEVIFHFIFLFIIFSS